MLGPLWVRLLGVVVHRCTWHGSDRDVLGWPQAAGRQGEPQGLAAWHPRGQGRSAHSLQGANRHHLVVKSRENNEGSGVSFGRLLERSLTEMSLKSR